MSSASLAKIEDASFKQRSGYCILQLVMGLNPGGISVHIRNLSRGLMSRGHRVVVCAGSVCTEEAVATVSKGDASRLAQISLAYLRPSIKYLPDLWHAAETLARVLREERPDVVNLHSISQLPVARLALRRANLGYAVPIVSTFNNEEIAGFKRRAGRIAANVARRPFGDAVIAISKGVAEVLVRDFGLSEDSISIIDYGVDDEHFRPPTLFERREARARLGVSGDEFVVCSVGTLCARKNQAAIIGALGLAPDRGGIRLVLAGPGDPQEQYNLRALAVQLGVEDLVMFPGLVDARNVFWAADVNILASFVEGFGLVVTEAAFCSLPSIRSSSAGAREQIKDGVDGILIDPGDPATIAAALERVRGDRSLLRRFGQSAFSAASARFTIANMTSQVESVYDGVVVAVQSRRRRENIR